MFTILSVIYWLFIPNNNNDDNNNNNNNNNNKESSKKGTKEVTVGNLPAVCHHQCRMKGQN